MNLKRTIFLTFMALLPVGCAGNSVQQGQIDCAAVRQTPPAAVQTIANTWAGIQDTTNSFSNKRCLCSSP